MTMAVAIPRWALLGLLLVLMSCTSGGTGGSGSPIVAVGPVTGFGSIVVNGVTFDTTDATITLNGQRGSEADLQLGHVVTVRGTRGPNGTVAKAETVTVDNNAKGPIDSIDPAMNRLVVLGQIVRLDDRTQFGDTPLSALEVGNIVEVSGFADADGQAVEVKSAQNVVNGVLLADSVEVKNVGVTGAPGDAIELQGIVTRILTADTFEVNGQPVRLTPTTVFESGTAADIALNVPIQVDGFFDAEGVLVAVEIDFLQ